MFWDNNVKFIITKIFSDKWHIEGDGKIKEGEKKEWGSRIFGGHGTVWGLYILPYSLGGTLKSF